MSQLFDMEENLSPMEEWRQRNQVALYKTSDGYRASTLATTAHGENKEKALLAWADKAKVKCWKIEELEGRES